MVAGVTSRAYTAEEARATFLSAVRGAVRYWASLPENDRATGEQMTVLSRCDGVAFSILNILDGTSSAMPAIDMLLAPHETDKQFFIDEGENWYEPKMLINNTMLHEQYGRVS
jgi:hypothetical protein